MDQEYNWIFDEAYRTYNPEESDFPVPSRLLLRRLRFEIDSVTEQANTVRKLRADAKAFLLINLYEMYVRPVAVRALFGGEERIWESLSSDLGIILDASRSDPNVQNREEITARDIIRGVNLVYDRLKLTNFNVWG
jgi:hypothetical protein